MPIEYSNMNNRVERSIDNKEFISEIAKRPVIWDTTSQLYCDKQLKKNAWDELVDIFYSTPEKEQRNECCRTLQRKWKSARDCFNRECQRLERTKQGLATTRKSPYIHYKNLSFLHKIMNKNKSINGTKNSEGSSSDTSRSTDDLSVSNIDTSLNTTDTSSTSNTDSLSSNHSADMPSIGVHDNNTNEDVTLVYNNHLISKRHRTEIDDDNSVFTRILQPDIQLIEEKTSTEGSSRSQEEDSDKLFLLSLQEPLQQVPKRLRMSVRVKIMQVVDSAMKWEKEHWQE